MLPEQKQPTPPPSQPPQPTHPQAAALPFHGRRPVLDARLGFRRQFTPTQPNGGAGQAALPTLAEQMGHGLYDDPYYQRKSPQPQRGKRRVAIVCIVLFVLACVASAVVFPTVKKHNPNGLFQSAGAQQ